MKRFDAVDALRGVAIVWMTAYHFAFDLSHLGFTKQDFYADPVWTWQRTCILSLFLFCAGVGQAIATAQGQSWPRFWKRWAQVAGCALLIPRYGMVGASVATAIAISGMSILQILEVRWLNGVHVEPARLWKPFAAGAAAFLVAYFAGEGLASLGAPRLVLALAKTVVLLVTYALFLLALRLDPEDAETVRKWRARRAGG